MQVACYQINTFNEILDIIDCRIILPGIITFATLVKKAILCVVLEVDIVTSSLPLSSFEKELEEKRKKRKAFKNERCIF